MLVSIKPIFLGIRSSMNIASSSLKGFSVKLFQNASHSHLFKNTISCHKTSQHYFEPLQIQPGGHYCEGLIGSDIMPVDK